MPQAMDEISRKVLSTVHDFLERLVAADNLTSEQITEASMAGTALRYQIARMDYPEDVLARVRDAEESLTNQLGLPSQALGRRRAWQDMWTGKPGSQLCAAIEASDPCHDQTLLDRIRELLVDYYTPMDAVVGAGTRSTYAGGRGDAQDRVDEEKAAAFTPEYLERWLRSTGNGSSQAKVTSVRQLMGGYSKATYIANLSDRDCESRIVVRKDCPGLPTGSSVVREYPVLQEMVAIGIPVPAPLWLETDPALCNGAYMGVAFADGTPANQIVPTVRETQGNWARSMAELLGRLHRATALDGTDVRDAVSLEIDDLEKRMLERERAPHPGLLIGLSWLRRHLDDLSGRPACRIHGDFGFHNMLMSGDRVAALLDWEFSRIGDPVEDLASIRPFMEQIAAWDDFYETYHGICGFSLDPVADSYFNVWREVRNMVACLGSLNSLLLPEVKQVALTVSGTIYIPKYEIAILDAIGEARAKHG